MKWMVWIILLLSQGWDALAGLQAVLLQHSLILLVWRNKGLQSWNTQSATHQRTGTHRIGWEYRSRVSGTGKRGIIKKSYFCFNCIFCSWNLVFSHSMFYCSVYLPGLPRSLHRLFAWNSVYLCVSSSSDSCFRTSRRSKLHLQELERSCAGLGPDSLGLFLCYWQ